jgi:hypothetical protein
MNRSSSSTPATNTTNDTVAVTIDSQTDLASNKDDSYSVRSPSIRIDNCNITYPNKVILLDVSCNKEWISYVTSDGKDTYLTIRNFTEMNFQEAPIHYSCNITKHVKSGGNRHCKFLSVSPDGKYIAFSFYERNIVNGGRLKNPDNPDCLVFVVGKTGIKDDCIKIKEFQGRAVFLDRKKASTHALALIDLETIKVYDKFPSSFNDGKGRPSYWFDLTELSSTGKLLRESVVNDEFHIKNVSWMATGEDGTDNEMKRLMTYSRHIRQNVLVTPFTNGNIVRVWSMIEDGIRLTSFPIAEKEHVMAFSKDYKYTASYLKGTRSLTNSKGTTVTINIYNVKSGLLVYKLKPRHQEDCYSSFEISHI